MNIVITLPTKLAHLVYEGTKTIEIRKSKPYNFDVHNDVVYVCEKGTNLVTGMFEVGRFESSTNPGQVWRDHHDAICIDREWWDAYTEKPQIIYLWHIKYREQFSKPYSLQDVFHVKKAPQSYVYTKTGWYLNDSFLAEVKISEEKAVQ